MKKNDIALLILIISISAVAAYFIGRAILGDSGTKSAEVEVVERFNTAIEEPNKDIFNTQAINPTVPIQIGSPSNQQPFGENNN